MTADFSTDGASAIADASALPSPIRQAHLAFFVADIENTRVSPTQYGAPVTATGDGVSYHASGNHHFSSACKIGEKISDAYRLTVPPGSPLYFGAPRRNRGGAKAIVSHMSFYSLQHIPAEARIEMRRSAARQVCTPMELSLLAASHGLPALALAAQSPFRCYLAHCRPLDKAASGRAFTDITMPPASCVSHSRELPCEPPASPWIYCQQKGRVRL